MTATTWEPGQRCEWMPQSGRGYGFYWWVPAVVVKVGRVRVQIDAALKNGGARRVWVAAKSLRAVA
jgi:hypothetical protein